MDSRADDSLMPFKTFIHSCLFPKATVESLHMTENSWVILEKYNSWNIEELGIYSVWLRHQIARWRFFIEPGNVPALFEMPDI